MYWAVMDGERLLATVQRSGEQRPGSLMWRLLWKVEPPPLELWSRLYASRHEAIAAVLWQHKGATVHKYSRRGERLQ